MHFNALLSFYKNPWSLFVYFYFTSLSVGLNWPQTIAWSYIHWSPGECSLNDQESGHGLGQLITPSGKYLWEGQVSCVCLWPDAPVKWTSVDIAEGWTKYLIAPKKLLLSDIQATGLLKLQRKEHHFVQGSYVVLVYLEHIFEHSTHFSISSLTIFLPKDGRTFFPFFNWSVSVKWCVSFPTKSLAEQGLVIYFPNI